MVTCGHDDDAYDEHVTITHLVKGYGAITYAQSVDVSVQDLDTAEIRISSVRIEIREGVEASYSIVLGSEPSSHVTVTPIVSDETKMQVVGIVEFSPSTWSTPQSVTVQALEDRGASDENLTVRHSVTGYDDVVDGPVLNVVVTDNDVVSDEFALASGRKDDC